MKNFLFTTVTSLILTFLSGATAHCEEERTQKSEGNNAEAHRVEALEQNLKTAKKPQKSVGTRTEGPPVLSSPVFMRYVSEIRKIFFSNFSWKDKDAPHVATTLIELAPSGMIKKVTLVNTSGSNSFDEVVIKSVWKSNPLPPPPPSHYSELKSIRLTFDSRE
jgi:hypothetical protein